MTPTYKETLLADILAALLRIEALMQREKVADSEVDYWVKRLRQPQPVLPTERAPEFQRFVERAMEPPAHQHPAVRLPGMPDPPIAPVRPQTVWGVNKATAHSLNQRRWMHNGWIHADGFSMVGP